MTDAATQSCPVCGTELPLEPRYPAMLCVPCGALARDEQGRALRFRNETPLAAGFIESHLERDSRSDGSNGTTLRVTTEGRADEIEYR